MKLTYVEFTTKFVYNKRFRQQQPRKQDSSSIARLHYTPSISKWWVVLYENFIHTTKRLNKLANIKIISGTTYKNFEEVCFTLGLLNDDKEFI